MPLVSGVLGALYKLVDNDNNDNDLRIYFDSLSSHSLASRPISSRPTAYVLCMPEAARGRRRIPLSISFTIDNLLPLFNCPVLSTCEYVSPVSHLTDTCPARSNCRTLVGVLDIQILSACSLLCIRLSPYAPPFYRHRPTSGPGQPSSSPRPVGLETRRLRLKCQTI